MGSGQGLLEPGAGEPEPELAKLPAPKVAEACHLGQYCLYLQNWETPFEEINFTTVLKLTRHDVFTSFWGWAMVVQLILPRHCNKSHLP